MSNTTGSISRFLKIRKEIRFETINNKASGTWASADSTESESPYQFVAEQEKKPKPITVMDAEATKKIIQEIHDSFYSEVDRLLESAKNFQPIETTMQAEIDKAKRLSKLGFNSSKDVIATREEEHRLSRLKWQNIAKQ